MHVTTRCTRREPDSVDLRGVVGVRHRYTGRETGQQVRVKYYSDMTDIHSDVPRVNTRRAGKYFGYSPGILPKGFLPTQSLGKYFFVIDAVVL